MTLKLQGKWEATRLADLCDYALLLTSTDRKLRPWLADVAKRIRAQVEAEDRSRRAANKFVGSACDGCRHWHVGCDMHGECKLDLALGTDKPMMACASRVERRTGKDE